MTTSVLDYAEMSVFERVALLPPTERVEFVDGLTEAERASPELWLRPSQLRAYHDTTSTVAMVSGRGAGKTRVGASWVNRKATLMPGSIGHLLGRTVADVRDVMVRGESGIIAVAEPSNTPLYIPSLRRLEWPNGSVALTFTSEKPAQLRGPQAHWTWCVAGGSMIATERGPVAIERVVPGERVWTRQGLKSVRRVVCNGIRETVRLGPLTLTPDHLVATADGWCPAGQVTLRANILAWNQHQDRPLGTTSRAPASTETDVTATTGIAPAECCSTTLSGSSTTAAPFPMVTRSTTLTRIGRTTPSPTSKRFLAQNTAVTTVLSTPPRCPSLSAEKQAASHGSAASPRPTPVSAAAPPWSLAIPAEPSTAVPPVATLHLAPRSGPDTLVYDLTVEDCPEYFANGILVHNCDEMAALNHRPDDSGTTAWDNVRIGTRLGAHPQIFVTTTPKRIAAVRDLINRGRTTKTVSLHGASTFANRAHLSGEYLSNLMALYAGTALERQELYGELIDIVESALWRPDDIVVDAEFLEQYLPLGTISVIGVDPGLTTGGDATGIVVARSTAEHTLTTRRALVVADYTEDNLQPERWAARVVAAWEAEREATGTVPIIVAEKNAGGELVASVMETQAGERVLPIALVPSGVKSKAARAEPIVLAYRQKRVAHIEPLTELELEMCVPGDTLVETARGPIQMQDISVTDLVLTRSGFAPIAWAGPTGLASELWGVSHSGGTVYSTACHPIWTETRGFVPAMSVADSDLLLARPVVQHPSRLRGAAVGGLSTLVTATTQALRDCCIAPSGEPTSERSLLAGMSITATETGPTTGSPTWSASHRRSTTPNTARPAGRSGSWGTALLSGALTPTPCGPSGSRGKWSVGTAGSPSCRPGCGACSALPVVARSATPLKVVGSPVPVFNLTVAPGYPPEYFANGILVHNCEWEPPVPGGARGSGWSPNRLDACVYALRALLVDDKPLRPFGTLEAQTTSEVLQVPQERWTRTRREPRPLNLPWRE